MKGLRSDPFIALQGLQAGAQHVVRVFLGVLAVKNHCSPFTNLRLVNTTLLVRVVQLTRRIRGDTGRGNQLLGCIPTQVG
jgi:hypothetical protein